MNGGFRLGSGWAAQSLLTVQRETVMLRTQRLARKSAARAVRSAGPDMALATTIVFFGVFPAVMAAGLVLVQILGAVVH
jgi:hypothetical protein